MDVEKESFWGPESQPRTAAEWSLWFPNDTLPASLVTHEGESNDEIMAPTNPDVHEISDGEETVAFVRSTHESKNTAVKKTSRNLPALTLEEPIIGFPTERIMAFQPEIVAWQCVCGPGYVFHGNRLHVANYMNLINILQFPRSFMFMNQ